jgi:hypothetical protein
LLVEFMSVEFCFTYSLVPSLLLAVLHEAQLKMLAR